MPRFICSAEMSYEIIDILPGVLCGSCKEGYVQSYISDECIPKISHCNTNIFVVYFVVLSFVYTVVFTFMPTIVATSKNIAKRITKKEVRWCLTLIFLWLLANSFLIQALSCLHVFGKLG